MNEADKSFAFLEISKMGVKHKELWFSRNQVRKVFAGE
jgi:hypothetical protein